MFFQYPYNPFSHLSQQSKLQNYNHSIEITGQQTIPGSWCHSIEPLTNKQDNEIEGTEGRIGKRENPKTPELSVWASL